MTIIEEIREIKGPPSPTAHPESPLAAPNYQPLSLSLLCHEFERIINFILRHWGHRSG